MADEKATDDGRILRVSTPLGKDFFLMESLEAREAVSSIYTVLLNLLHEEEPGKPGPPHEVKPEDILGKPVTIELTQSDGTIRHFHGIVSRFRQGNRSPRYTYYSMDVVPKLWMLTLTQQSRIFQDKDVKQILETVLSEKGIDFKIQTERTYQPRNYCVQYRETDFNFVSRMMEEEGIYYYFEHTAEKHTMIIGDTQESHKDCPSKSSIEFVKERTDEKILGSVVREWLLDYLLQTGKIERRDYHFQIPPQTFLVQDTSRYTAFGNQEVEHYDWPGEYAQRFDGVSRSGGDQEAKLQKIFQDSVQVVKSARDTLDAKHKTFIGKSDCASLTAGHVANIDKLPIKDHNGQYVFLSVMHHCDQSPDHASNDERNEPYVNHFECIPVKKAEAPTFRPQKITPKPTIYGPMTATVVGRAGEEIDPDKYGRVKVQFHWDREGKNDLDSSCWLRVCTSIAGNKWGTMYIPRIGQEVVVAFEHGDPDQPIIIGSVYNAESMPHYELPKYKTLTYIHTRTSPDSGKGFNSLRFEDKAKKEQVFIHSQKRYDMHARGSMYETCAGNRNEVIGYKVIDSEGNEKSGGNLAITVGGNFDLHVCGDHYIGIDGKLNETVKGDVIKDYQAVFHTQVGSKAEMTAPEITFEANTKITFKVGSSFITLAPGLVTISGTAVNINSGGTATGPSFPSMEEPLDAEAADTGEPGYLDRPRTGGGGGGRRSKILHGNRLPNVRRNADGSFQVGNNIRVEGNLDFQRKALTNLSTLSSTRTGNNIITALDNGTHQTTIRELDMATAQRNGALATRVDPTGATTPGTGSDTIIQYNPDLVDNTYVDENGNNQTVPIESTLGHEMIHAVHNDSGNNLRNNPEPAEAGSNEEESQTIGIHGHANDEMTENNILRDMNQDFRRTDHDSTVQTVP